MLEGICDPCCDRLGECAEEAAADRLGESGLSKVDRLGEYDKVEGTGSDFALANRLGE